MIFVDANIPMYLVGTEHPLKRDAATTVRRLIGDRRRMVTSVEVFGEVLHRYVSTGRRDRVQPAFEALRGLVEIVIGVVEADVIAAKNLALSREGLSARDALHAAVMERHEISEILSFDADFDQLPGITRLP